MDTRRRAHKPLPAGWRSPLVLKRLSPKCPPTLSRLAAATDMTPGELSHILCRRREPGLGKAARIARALKIDLDRLHEVLSAA